MEQSVLLSVALEASVKVQVDEDLLTASETREGVGAAAARLAARPAHRRCVYEGIVDKFCSTERDDSESRGKEISKE